MTKLYNIYIENEYNLDYIFKIYYFLLRNEISLEDCEKVLSIAYDTIKLYKTRSTLTEEIEGLKQMKNNYLLNQNSMKNHQLPSLGPLPRYYNW